MLPFEPIFGDFRESFYESLQKTFPERKQLIIYDYYKIHK